MAALAGCNDKTTVGPSSAGAGGAGGGGGEVATGGEPSWIIETGSGGCDTILYDPPNQKAAHVAECSKINYFSNPPTAGPHYPKWAKFKIYDLAFPRGYYVHSMEHGGVVLHYNCPSGCASEVAALQQFVDTYPGDPKCPDGGVGGAGGSPSTGGTGGTGPELLRHRVILLPDPDIDVPFAVSTWGFMLKAQCFDESLVRPFVEEHYAHGTEDICGGGLDPTDPAEMIPADCGK